MERMLAAAVTPHDEPTDVEIDNTYNFHEEVDQALGDDLEVD